MASNRLFGLGSLYEIEETFSGGESIVYRAWDEQARQRVAIRVPNEAVRNNPDWLDRFVREARVLKNIDHPNIRKVIQYYEPGTVDQGCYVICEWLDQTLEDVVAAGAVPVDVGTRILKDILSGLEIIHNSSDEGLVHRDLKPANIFLSEDLRDVKVGDLGMAAPVGVQQTVKITAHYVSPDLFDGDVDKRADLYSVGMIALDLFLGREGVKAAFPTVYDSAPDSQTEELRWLNWHRGNDPAPLLHHDQGSDIPESISRIVAKLLAKDRNERYESARSVLDDLNKSSESSRPFKILDPDGEKVEAPGRDDDQRAGVPTKWVLAASIAILASVLAIILVPREDPQRLAAIQARAEALSMLAEARSMGAADESHEIATGKDRGRIGNGMLDDGQYQQATAAFTEAKRHFEAALELVRESRQAAEAARSAAIKGISESNDLSPARLSSAQSSVDEGDQNFAKRDYGAALESFELALAHLSSTKSLDTPPPKTAIRTAWLGSTPTELDHAVSLCETFSEDCLREWYSSERHRKVTLSPFRLDAHEVSNRQFAQFVQDTGYTTVAESTGFSYMGSGGVAIQLENHSWRAPDGPGSSIENKEDHPVAHISALDAHAFCEWAGGRLPSEDEWEYSARGQQRRLFPWGDNWDGGLLSWAGAPDPGTKPVGSYPGGATRESEIFDLAGSMWEWTSDLTEEGLGVLKGGSFAERNPANFRSAARRYSNPSTSHADDGFRCAHDLDSWM